VPLRPVRGLDVDTTYRRRPNRESDDICMSNTDDESEDVAISLPSGRSATSSAISRVAYLDVTDVTHEDPWMYNTDTLEGFASEITSSPPYIPSYISVCGSGSSRGHPVRFSPPPT
jgi:hypothetical protein